MTDRLADLKKGVAVENVEIEIKDTDRALVRNDRSEGPKGAGGEAVGSMQEFFRIVEIVKKNIVAIRDAAKNISEINQELVFATTEEKEESASQGLAQLIQTGNKNAKTAQGLLKDLNKEVKDMEESKGSPASELRIRKNLVQTLTKKYIDVLKEYQNVQNKSKEVKKKRAVKRVQQIKPDATPEEIEAVVQSGNAGSIMKQSILQGDAADVIRNAYENATSKYQDVLRLEASVAELAQMFQDFALIVEQQGELLDQIEYQVKTAADFIDEGNTHMVGAIEIQKSIRAKQCCIAVIVLIVIGIIALFIALKVKGVV